MCKIFKITTDEYYDLSEKEIDIIKNKYKLRIVETISSQERKDRQPLFDKLPRVIKDKLYF